MSHSTIPRVLYVIDIPAFVAAFFQGGLLQVSAVNQQPKIKQAYLAAVLRQDITFLDNNPVGKIQTSIAEDMDLIVDAMGEKLGEAIQTLTTFVAGLAIGFYLSWSVMYTCILGVCVLLFLYMMGDYIFNNERTYYDNNSTGNSRCSLLVLCPCWASCSATS
jgi:ABC-type multidrug transport system fused ATPase/permease subunit